MKTKLLLFTLLLPTLMLAQVGNGFENLPGITFDGGACRYFDANTTTHELNNYVAGCGTIYVKEPSSGATLGYSIVLDPNTANGTLGFSDGDAFGVATATHLTNDLSTTPPEGTQAFAMEDTDGDVTMTFDTVDLSSTTNPQFSMQYYVAATSWEAADYIRVELIISGCGAATTVTLIDTQGMDIDDDFPAIEGNWNTLNADLTPYTACTAQLAISFSSNAATEEFAIDAVSFSAGMTLSTPSVDLNNEISVFPNPSNGNITIKNAGAALNEVIITDINGRTIDTLNLNGITTDKNLDLSSKLSSGLYFMTIYSENASTVKKLIIK